MRTLNELLINGVDTNATTNSAAVWVGEGTFRATAIGVVAGTGALGTLKMQGSNDPKNTTLSDANKNWANIASASIAVSGSGNFAVPLTELCYEWLRLVYTDTALFAQTVAAIADTGVAEVSRVTTVADVAGSLNNKWFAISSINASTKVQKNFYVWLDNGSGVDPAVAGKTGVHVTYSNDDTAATLATAIGVALAALTSDFASSTPSTAVLNTTNAKPGNVTNVADGTAATGFAFATPTPGVNSNLNNTYFVLQNANDAISFYVWFNVASIGTDPAVAGKTAIAVAINASATASSIGGTMATAIGNADSTNSFTASNASGTVTVTNKVAGPTTAASDSSGGTATGFTFTRTVPSTTSTVTARLKAFGM